MDAFLGKITGHAMNYAIRTGIGITASFAISQTSRLLKTVDNKLDYQELNDLQERFNSKITILSPAIDMIDMISARGNSTLASAFALTTDLRRDIEAVGARLERAATASERSQKANTAKESQAIHALEIRQIIKGIKRLLLRIEDAVPLINLAITTSGASLSTALPPSVSPSRLLQASTFLTTGDAQYCMTPYIPVQVGPTFTLSLYMLFAGHSKRASTESMRDTTWKEVIHKARVKLVRVPLDRDSGRSGNGLRPAAEEHQGNSPVLPLLEDGSDDSRIVGEEIASEFAYQLELIEDFDDDRVHSFEDGEAQPGPYGDVRLAGIRELLPIYQVSKIFYADTGKILNIGTQGEANSPVLLLKRNINAVPPRKMMEEGDNNDRWQQAQPKETDHDSSGDESQDDIDQQIRRESSVNLAGGLVEEEAQVPKSDPAGCWQLPLGLDPEWLALEVYIEPDEESGSEDGQDANDDSAYISSDYQHLKESQIEANLAAELEDLNLDLKSSPPSMPYRQVADTPLQTSPAAPFIPTVRSSLSLLEMLIRLTALQQVHQTSHLAIPDEFLNFFLQESSTTGGNPDERQRTRLEARQKVGFDPYNESPIKHHGEDYQYQAQGQGYERGGTPSENDQGYGNGFRYEGSESPGWQDRNGSLAPEEEQRGVYFSTWITNSFLAHSIVSAAC
ncbi:Ran-binding 30 [Hyphodiscus hymeniophilus]|uniref:Ran-binding 30 n=1 Tax=Hyphodiscus hymeniophilus TaxID=353542 RepID=A0A9P6VPG9_9HELO|nr:Ran-binding 30 [Hyphodiscus hymeniophilus]